MAVISITRLRLRSWRFLPEFIFYSVRAKLQAEKAEGNRGVRVMREPGNIFWTATAWDSEDAVKKYMIASPHSQAMPRLLEWCDEAALVRWTRIQRSCPIGRKPIAACRPKDADRRSTVPPPTSSSSKSARRRNNRT